VESGFALEAPKIISPKDNDTVTNPVEIRWNKVVDAIEYKIFLKYLNSSYSSLNKDLKTSDSSIVLKLSSGCNYRLYILAIDKIQNSSIDSSDFTIICDKLVPPIPIQPANDEKSTFLRLLFEFDGNCYSRFFFQVAYDSLFRHLVYNADRITINKFYLTSLLEYNTKYYWRVMSFNGSEWSEWSETFRFTTRADTFPIARPILLEPINGTVNTPICTLKLKWKLPPNTADFKLYYSRDNFVNDSILFQMFYYPRELDSVYFYSLTNDTKFYWKIIADSYENGTVSSEVSSFTTTSDSIPKLLYPKNGDTVSNGIVVFKWSSTPRFKSFKFHLFYFDKKNNYQSYDATINNDTTISVLVQLQGIKYSWRISSINGNICLFNLANSDFYTAPNPYGDPEIPEWISPYNNQRSVDLKPTFRWKSSKYSTKYILMIDESNGKRILEQTNIKDTVFYNDSIQLKQETMYYGTLCSENDGGYSDWKQIYFFTGKETNVEQLVNSEKLSISHSSNSLIISFEIDLPSAELYIYDLLGRIVQRERVDLRAGENSVMLNENIPDCFLCVVKAGKHQTTKLFMK